MEWSFIDPSRLKAHKGLAFDHVGEDDIGADPKLEGGCPFTSYTTVLCIGLLASPKVYTLMENA